MSIVRFHQTQCLGYAGIHTMWMTVVVRAQVAFHGRGIHANLPLQNRVERSGERRCAVFNATNSCTRRTTHVNSTEWADNGAQLAADTMCFVHAHATIIIMGNGIHRTHFHARGALAVMTRHCGNHIAAFEQGQTGLLLQAGASMAFTTRRTARSACHASARRYCDEAIHSYPLILSIHKRPLAAYPYFALAPMRRGPGARR